MVLTLAVPRLMRGRSNSPAELVETNAPIKPSAPRNFIIVFICASCYAVND
jgi:hypothetical protein